MEEIERRFLCRLDAEFSAQETRSIEQGYLAGGELQIRIRRLDDSFVLGAKHGGGLRRVEREVPVSPLAGRELMEQAGDWRLSKTRHRAGRWELDVYGGKLEGLTVAECELDDPGETLPDPPSGVSLGAEITERLDLTAQQLARLDPGQCRALLAELQGP